MLIITIGIIVVIICRRRGTEKKIVIKDMNPTYGDNTEYEGYYTETQLTNENKHYNSEDYYEDDSEIREKNVIYN